MKKSYIVVSTCNDMRLDRWIRFTIGKIPQGLIEKNLRSGKIKLNNKKINTNLILELILFKSSKNERAQSIKQNPNIINQVVLYIFSKKKTNKVAIIRRGIKIKPAHFGFGTS